MHCQLEDLNIQLESEKITGQENTTKAGRSGYQRGQEERTCFFHKFPKTLAPADFQQKRYFEAWVQYIEDSRCVHHSGEDPNMVVFQYDVPEDDNLGDPESTIPLDGEGLVEDVSDEEGPNHLAL